MRQVRWTCRLRDEGGFFFFAGAGREVAPLQPPSGTVQLHEAQHFPVSLSLIFLFPFSAAREFRFKWRGPYGPSLERFFFQDRPAADKRIFPFGGLVSPSLFGWPPVISPCWLYMHPFGLVLPRLRLCPCWATAYPIVRTGDSLR